MIVALIIFTMLGKPVYLLEGLAADRCLEAAEVVNEKFHNLYYAECIVQESVMKL